MAKGYQLIQAQTLTSSAASVTFSNIPQNFTDLVLKINARGTRTGTTTGDSISITFNGVGGTSYSDRAIRGSGSAVITYTDASAAIGSIGRMPAAGQTASTFGNTEVLIPIYTGSTNKSYFTSSISENNATEAYMEIVGGLFSNTAAITSLSLTCTNSFDTNSTFTLYGIGGARATGGTIASDHNYTYHTFTSTSTFTPLEKIKNAEILLVAGGGGAGGAHGGGGGAGGVISYRNQTFLAGTSYTTVVGAGGVGSSSSAAGTNGGISSLGSLTAIGGGGGGTYAGTTTSAGSSGGSGGGGSNYPNNTVYSGGTGTSGQGYAGGNSSGNNAGGGGGGGGGSSPTGPGAGGSSAIGYDGINYGTITQGGGTGGFGGAGTSVYHSWHVVTSTGVISNGTYYIAGGGAGGSYVSPTSGTDRGAVASLGGVGGGGYGGRSTATGNYTPVAGSAGTTNSGSGGGGGAGNGGSGFSGGSGLVIIRYPSL